MEEEEKMSELIWRYMDLSKFIDLLSKRELFFTRADNFQDPFEGATTQTDFLSRKQLLQNLTPGQKPGRIYYEGEWVTIESLDGNDQERFFKKIREIFFINCWHLNTTESEAMWKLYLKSGEGIAIQTTIDSIKENIGSPFDENIEVDEVNYIDYENDEMATEHGYTRVFFHKRDHFAHEKEFRLITPYIKKKDIGEEYKILDEEEQKKLYGIHVPIKNLNKMIKKVYISPTAPDWFSDVVSSVMEKYELRGENGEIQLPYQSSLKNIPIF